MSEIRIHCANNLTWKPTKRANLIYADCIYESSDLTWIFKYWLKLAKDGVFIVQTDYHSSANIKLFLDMMSNSHFIAEVIYKQEWGGTPKKGFPIKHDNIWIYSKGDGYKWDKSKIEIPKKTAGTAFDKKGTGLKTPCSVFDDLGNFSTMSKERVKDENGKNVRWQKPLSLLRRLMLPFLDPGDYVIDPFCGVGTSAVVASEIGCDYDGIEIDEKICNLAKRRLGLL